MKILSIALALTALTAAVPMAHAAGNANYPDKPIRLIVPYAVGGATDVIGRVTARYLGEALGQSIVVENKPGAGGRIALENLRNAVGDGSVIVLSQVSAFSIYPHIYSKLPYQAKDFEPISIGAIMHHGLAVGPPPALERHCARGGDAHRADAGRDAGLVAPEPAEVLAALGRIGPGRADACELGPRYRQRALARR